MNKGEETQGRRPFGAERPQGRNDANASGKKGSTKRRSEAEQRQTVEWTGIGIEDQDAHISLAGLMQQID